MSKVFKINILRDREIKEIHVFNSNKDADILKLDMQTEKLKDIFSEEEILNINKNSIQIFFHDLKIRYDDTIDIIKKKICMVLNNEVSIHEIYMFATYNETLKSIDVYNNLTNSDKTQLTRERLIQYLLNIHDINVDDLEAKEIYDYADIKELNLNGIFKVNNSIVHKYVTKTNKYLYTSNPFDISEIDKGLLQFSETMLSTQNKSVLLDFGDILENNIYVVFAEDIITYTLRQDENLVESVIKVYYPFLHNNSITSLELLEENKFKLKEETKAMIDENFINRDHTVELMHELYNKKEKEHDYESEGIKYINLIMYSISTGMIPLDSMHFK